MKKYDQHTMCAKCGHKDTKDKWEAFQNISSLGGEVQVPERIVRTCQNCGYCWSEKPKDSPDKTDA